MHRGRSMAHLLVVAVKDFLHCVVNLVNVVNVVALSTVNLDRTLNNGPAVVGECGRAVEICSHLRMGFDQNGRNSSPLS
ncbi:hypothetical protein BC936DRAFT_140112 [Jimgerdemannia flammicorona]|uniref:Secreted protein n=1 Tax=Jimgerdemannia flammicorona TaxID=994334 RepID=A0A433B1S7_9FUNG|nr:hypothetical protein BC936DRAFT_140112 [Jimgerdemannia flammicorona]